MGLRKPSLVVGMLALFALFAVPPSSLGAVATCTPEVSIDPAGDVVSNPAVVPDAANGFNRLDIQTVCFTEDASSTFVVLGVGAGVNSLLLQEYNWRFTFKVGDGADQFIAYTHANGAPSSQPEGKAESEGARIQFTIAKSAAAVGQRIRAFFFQAEGQFVDQNGNTITGTDRGPNAGGSSIVYVVGTKAPPGTDTDADGVDDATEVQRGTNPGSPDTDGDGLKDGEEVTAGTNATRPDTDGDGLLDGQEKQFSTDPRRADTDDDGINDKDETTGARNQGYPTKGFVAAAGGSTDPSKSDTDGDGLDDGAEVTGSAQVGGNVRRFTPTDPNTADTDGDGLTDLDEVNGLHVTPAKLNVKFNPTDPTKADTDGDGVNDFDEVQAQSDPVKDDQGASVSSAVVQYLPFSLVLLALVVLVSAGGILWRWG